MKRYLETIKLSAPLSLLVATLGYWIFYGSPQFIPAPLIAGACLAAALKEKKAYKFLGPLAVSSLAFGFLTMLLTYSEAYMFSNWFYGSGMPFWPLYRPSDFLAFSLIFAFLGFMGGLIGVVLKESYYLFKNK